MYVWQIAEQKGITFEQVEKCFLQEYTTEDAHHSVMELVAEKVTFLSTKKDKSEK